ncbi:MAG: hypothetical protein ACE5IK_08195 [Acidobacteriota bacterium]
MKKMSHPELLDMGYTTGNNIDYFVRLGCKVHVDDYIATTLQRRASAPPAKRDAAASTAARRSFDRRRDRSPAKRPPERIAPLDYETGQFNVVLCWDLFDYLSPEAAVQTGRELRRITGAGGLLLAFFGPRSNTAVRPPRRFRIVGEAIEVQEIDGPRVKPYHLANREVQKIFADFEVSQTVLLKSGVREMLMRKESSTRDGRPSTLVRRAG